MQNLKSKRFVIRKSLIGKNQIIEVTFKSGKSFTYNHDKVYEIMKDKLENMNCFKKYKSYTSSTNVPVIIRDKEVV
jgi:DNA polymerase III psi subunit